MEISWDQCGQAGWEYLSNLARAPMQQRWEYGAVHAALGGQVKRAVVWENGRPVALCQCLIRRLKGILHLSLATNGPLWLAPCNHTRVIGAIRRSLPVRRLRVNLFTLPETVKSARLISLMTPATHAIRPLPVTPEMLHGKWRNALRRVQSSGLHSRHFTCSPAALAQLLETDANQQVAKSYRALPADFTLKWHALAAEDLRLITVGNDHETLASALFIRHGNTATYHIAHTSEHGRKTSAQRLVLWRAFQDFGNQGITQIDLGKIDTEFSPGLARFKLGTGANTLHIGPTVLAI